MLDVFAAHTVAGISAQGRCVCVCEGGGPVFPSPYSSWYMLCKLSVDKLGGDGEGNGNPLQYSCLEKSMDRGAWWAEVHGVT